MGYIAGGFMAKKLLPIGTIGKLVAGVNINGKLNDENGIIALILFCPA